MCRVGQNGRVERVAGMYLSRIAVLLLSTVACLHSREPGWSHSGT